MVFYKFITFSMGNLVISNNENVIPSFWIIILLIFSSYPIVLARITSAGSLPSGEWPLLEALNQWTTRKALRKLFEKESTRGKYFEILQVWNYIWFTHYWWIVWVGRESSWWLFSLRTLMVLFQCHLPALLLRSPELLWFPSLYM